MWSSLNPNSTQFNTNGVNTQTKHQVRTCTQTVLTVAGADSFIPTAIWKWDCEWIGKKRWVLCLQVLEKPIFLFLCKRGRLATTAQCQIDPLTLMLTSMLTFVSIKKQIYSTHILKSLLQTLSMKSLFYCIISMMACKRVDHSLTWVHNSLELDNVKWKPSAMQKYCHYLTFFNSPLKIRVKWETVKSKSQIIDWLSCTIFSCLNDPDSNMNLLWIK